MRVFPAANAGAGAAGGVEYSSSVAGLAFGPTPAFFDACDSIPVMPGASNTEQRAGPQPPALQGLLHCWQLGGPLGGGGDNVGDSGDSGDQGGVGGDVDGLPAGLCGWASAGQGAGVLGQPQCGDWWAAGNDADGGLLGIVLTGASADGSSAMGDGGSTERAAQDASSSADAAMGR